MDPVADLLGGGKTIAYKTVLAHLTGSITAGLLLSQFWYYTNLHEVSHRDGWFWKTAEEIRDETGMGRYELEQARKRLKELGLLEEDLRGVPATKWYRLDKERLYKLLADYAANKIAENQQTAMQETSKQEGGKPANKIAIKPDSTTETTTKNPKDNNKETEIVVASVATLLCALQAEDIPPKVARKLLDQYGEAAIRQQLAWLPQRKHDPERGTRAGLLRKAIEENWGAPATKKPLPRPKVRQNAHQASQRPQEATAEDVAAMRASLQQARQKMRVSNG